MNSIINIDGATITLLVFAATVLVVAMKAVIIVPQSQQFLVENFGKYSRTLTPGLNLIVPFINRVAHKESILERTHETPPQSAITKDNVTIDVQVSAFFKVIEPQKSVYEIDNVNEAIAKMVESTVRAEIGKIDLDTVQASRDELGKKIIAGLTEAVTDWGVKVTRVEITSVDMDEETQASMRLMLNAERERRAAEVSAEGEKQAMQTIAEGKLFEVKKDAEGRILEANAEATATTIIARALSGTEEGPVDGLIAAQYQIAMTQVKAIGQAASGNGTQTIILPSDAVDMFGDAFKLLGGRALTKK